LCFILKAEKIKINKISIGGVYAITPFISISAKISIKMKRNSGKTSIANKADIIATRLI
jgi:hypothetical protein